MNTRGFVPFLATATKIPRSLLQVPYVKGRRSCARSPWQDLCGNCCAQLLYKDICRMSCARDPVYIGSVRRELKKNITAWDSRWANKSNPTDIYQVKPNTPNSMLNKTLSSFLCVQGLIFLSTGAKRGAKDNIEIWGCGGWQQYSKGLISSSIYGMK